MEIMFVLALAHQAGDDIPAALTPLQRALSLAEPQGYGRIFIDEDPPIAHLLSAAAAQGLMPAYTHKLLSAFSTARQEQPAASKTTSEIQNPKSEIVEPLSARELEVLQLIAEGLTNKQIADRLYLSLNTIKVHNRNIYSKLDAHHRTEAVASARELGII